MAGSFQRARWRVLFDGQSLNHSGLVFATVLFRPENNAYPKQLMADFPTVPWKQVAVSGASWNQLTDGGANWGPATTRLHPQFGWADNTVLIMCGGTTDVAGGDTGATVYGDMVAYANAAKAAGCDYVIATTISPSTIYSGPMNTERLDANSRLIADASNAFDGVADVCVSPINNPSDTTYYFDGLHGWDSWAMEVAAIVKPVLEAIPGFPAAA